MVQFCVSRISNSILGPEVVEKSLSLEVQELDLISFIPELGVTLQ